MVKAADAKAWAKENMHGIWTSPLAVFSGDNYALDDDALRENTEYLISMGADGLGYGHSEPWTMLPNERKASAEVFLDTVGGRLPTYLHVTDHCAPLAVEFANHVAERGADLVMMHPPFEWAKTDEHIYDYVSYLADNSDIGILLLNTPHSGRIMSPELLARLAAIPAVCGLKNGINDLDQTKATVALCGSDIVVSHPREEEAIECISVLHQQIQLGTSAFYLLQTPDWQPVRAYVEAAKHGDLDVAQSIYDAIAPVRDLWISMYTTSLWSGQAEHPIAMTKVWMDAIGMHGGPVRPPMTQVSEVDAQEFGQKIDQAFSEARRATEGLMKPPA